MNRHESLSLNEPFLGLYSYSTVSKLIKILMPLCPFFYFRTYFPQFVPLALNEPFLGLDSLGMKAPDEVNFQVLCLYAKVFARSGFPFADYLARMSNPPPFQTTRSNIQALKIMEALNNLEG